MKAPCARCRLERHLKPKSGLCASCYVTEVAKTAQCVKCTEVRKIQGKGLCRRCYLAQPEVRARKNEARRRRYQENPVRRAAAALNKIKDPNAPQLQANRNRRFFYGMAPGQFEEMLADQDHKCWICKTSLIEARGHVDHCHKTGKIRGILCRLCNGGLGFFRDNPESLAAAIRYLAR